MTLRFRPHNLEHGHLHSPSYEDGERIIRIAKKAQGKRLDDYDRAMERALSRLKDDHGR